MKALITLLGFFMALDAIAVAPYGFRGQNQTATQYSNVLQFPNNQVTNIGGINSLVETGNTNILVNPGFEHSTYTTGWTTTGTTATLSAETVTIIHGKKALETVASSQNISIVQDSTLYASQLAGVQGFVKAWISNTAPSVSMCARAAGVTLTGNNCVTLATDGLWKEYVIPVVLSATSNGISIAATSVTGTTIVDEAFVGVVPNAMPEVSQPQIAGTSYWAAGVCTQTRTSSTPGAMTGVSGCPGPTIEIQNRGTWATTDADMIKQTITNLEPGDYVAEFQFTGYTSASVNTLFSIFDGTTNCAANNQTSGTNSTPFIVRCPFRYTSSGTRVFEIYTSSASGTVTVSNESGTGVSRQTRFTLFYYPPASKVYSQGCADPRKCENVFSAKISSGGVVTNESLDWISGNCTAANPTVCTFNSGIFTVAPNCVYSVENTSTAIVTHSVPETSSAFSARMGNSSTGGLAANNFSVVCVKQGADFKPENMITGTFANVVTAPGISKPKTCYYFFGGSGSLSSPTACSSSPCTEYYDSCSAVSSAPTRTSAGIYPMTIDNGTWAANTPLVCFCQSSHGGGNFDCTPNSPLITNSSGGATFSDVRSYSATGTLTDRIISIQCTAQAP